MYMEPLKTWKCLLTKLEMTFTLTKPSILVQIMLYLFSGNTTTSSMIVKFTWSQPVSLSSPVWLWSLISSFFAVLTPTKTYHWFKKNSSWQEDWKQIPIAKLCHQWVTDYKPKPESKVPWAFNSRAEPEPSLNVVVSICLLSYKLTLSISHTKSCLLTLNWTLIPTIMMTS